MRGCGIGCAGDVRGCGCVVIGMVMVGGEDVPTVMYVHTIRIV